MKFKDGTHYRDGRFIKPGLVDELQFKVSQSRQLEQITRLAEHLLATNPRLCRFLVTGFALTPMPLIAAVNAVMLFSIFLAFLFIARLSHIPGGEWLWEGIFQGAPYIYLLIFPALSPFIVALVAPFLYSPAPGLKLSKEQAPELYKTANAVASKFGITIDTIIIQTEMNCSVSSTRKLSSQRNYLYIGYPTLMAMSIFEFEAILAHEAAHLKLNHTRENALIRALNRVWHNNFEDWRLKNPLMFLTLGPAFAVYLPILDSLTLSLSRYSELAADQLGAAFMPRERFAKALLAFVLRTELHQNTLYDNIVASTTREQSENEKHLYQDSAQEANKSLTLEVYKKRWQTLLSEGTVWQETHPCLARRLVALGFAPSDMKEDWQPDWHNLFDNSPKAVTLLGTCGEQVDKIMSGALLESIQTDDTKGEEQGEAQK